MVVHSNSIFQPPYEYFASFRLVSCSRYFPSAHPHRCQTSTPQRCFSSSALLRPSLLAPYTASEYLVTPSNGWRIPSIIIPYQDAPNNFCNRFRSLIIWLSKKNHFYTDHLNATRKTSLLLLRLPCRPSYGFNRLFRKRMGRSIFDRLNKSSIEFFLLLPLTIPRAFACLCPLDTIRINNIGRFSPV